MKEVWKEILDGLDKKVLILTLLSTAFIALLAAALIFGLSHVKNQVESSINNPNLKNIQTNFTE